VGLRTGNFKNSLSSHIIETHPYETEEICIFLAICEVFPFQHKYFLLIRTDPCSVSVRYIFAL